MCCLTVHYNSGKKRLVQLAVLCGWHYQNKSYPVVEISCDSSIILSFFKILFKFYFEKLFKIIKKKFIKMSLVYLLFDFFVWQQQKQLFSPPPPPLPLLSRPKLWFNFILGLTVIFFCFQLIIIHHHTQKPTYLGSKGNCLSRKAEMATSVVVSGYSLFSLPPPPPTVKNPLPPLPHPPAPKLTQPPKGIVWSLTWSTCHQNSLWFFPRK